MLTEDFIFYMLCLAMGFLSTFLSQIFTESITPCFLESCAGYPFSHCPCHALLLFLIWFQRIIYSFCRLALLLYLWAIVPPVYRYACLIFECWLVPKLLCYFFNRGSVLSYTCVMVAINSITDTLTHDVKGALYVDDFTIYASDHITDIIEIRIRVVIN